MNFYRRRTTPCERWVRAISLCLDGEASPLEVTALDRHLASCARCAEIAVETASLTQLLRAAPLLEPERRVVVTSPHRARRQLVRRTVAVCLVVTGLSVASGLAFFGGSGQKHPNSALGFRDLHEQRRFVRTELIRLEPRTVVAVQAAPRFAGHALL